MSPKRKGRSRSRKRGSGNKVFLILVLIGVGLIAYVVFREARPPALKPRPEKRTFRLEKKPTEATKKTVLLYFSDQEQEYLIGEKREIQKRDRVEEEASDLVVELTRGPKGALLPTLPPSTRLLDLQITEAGVARVNFSKAICQNHPGGSSAEIMTVYSVVHSLTANFPEIRRVQFLIEGKEVETITGHISLKAPLSPNAALVKTTAKR